jgi:hypothetical protein
LKRDGTLLNGNAVDIIKKDGPQAIEEFLTK